MFDILIVEDDIYLRDGLMELFEREGYRVTAAATAREAEAAMYDNGFSLIVLDIALPDGDGIELCRNWRARGILTPILYLTARDEEISIVRGLDAGGNDYVAKPFRVLELLSRVRALLRDREGKAIERHGLVIDLSRMSVTLDGEQVYVTPTEFKILSALMRNSRQILTRAQLLSMIWDAGDQFIDDNTLSVHVSRLREKIGEERIRTVRGVGYKWEEWQ